MADDGDYPFYVKVRNRFLIGENRPEINVEYHFHQHGHKENPFIKSLHRIEPGEALSFPLHWRTEYLEITIPLKAHNSDNVYDFPREFYLWCGTEALCHLINNDKTISLLNGKEPTVPALEKKRDSPDPDSDKKKYNVGGAWAFTQEDKDTNFKLTIRKRTDDPEEENVTIGENPPG